MSVSNEKQIIIKAINELGRRVSVADIATKTGLPVANTSQTINQIAAETGGHLQVSAKGDIAYLFPIGYQTRYLTKGIERSIELFGKQVFTFAFFLLRISFGVMLILSLLILSFVFFAIVISGSRNKDNDEFNFDFNFFDWMILRELFYWNFDYPTYTYDRYNRPVKRGKNNFLYNCFSFLFGDGNPNANLDERRWQAIAQLIRQHNGALTVDQLSPYTGVDPTNEDAVLPILVRFDGQPTVTDSGNIIYLFPSLQSTAINNSDSKLAPYLNEFLRQFSTAGVDSMIWVSILAAVNFLGSWWLYLHILPIAALSALKPLLLILVVYGTAFIAVPLTRYLSLQMINRGIESRNKLKQDYASRLDHPDENLEKKLAEAKTRQVDRQQIKSNDLIYDTRKDTLEQQIASGS